MSSHLLPFILPFGDYHPARLGVSSRKSEDLKLGEAVVALLNSRGSVESAAPSPHQGHRTELDRQRVFLCLAPGHELAGQIDNRRLV